MNKNDLIGSRDAAVILGVSRSQLNRDVLAGKVPYAAKVPGPVGAYLFDADALRNLTKETAHA